MIKFETVVIEYKEKIVKDIVCNKCSKSLKDRMDMNYEGITNVSGVGGYASKIGDGVEYSFSLCEDCLLDLFLNHFEISPYEDSDEELA